MKASTLHLHVGPSAWRDADWLDGGVNSLSEGRRRQALAAIARYVNLAEIDETFHAPMRPETAAVLVRRVAPAPDFVFTALLGRQFTHDRNLDAGAVEAWSKGFRPLERSERLGAVILRFPWPFAYTTENREFLIRLRRAFHEFPLAAEFRHESWLRDEAVTTLIQYRVGFVNIDQPQYFRAMPPAALLTSGVAVVRLNGRQSPEEFRDLDKEDRVAPHLYTNEELEEWLPRLKRLAGCARRTLVVTANRGGANALVNALQLREMLGFKDLLAPEELIRKYPAELAGYRSRRPVQPMLVGVERRVA
jgi:uncharacterized protein YecE (DUF72 family)